VISVLLGSSERVPVRAWSRGYPVPPAAMLASIGDIRDVTLRDVHLDMSIALSMECTYIKSRKRLEGLAETPPSIPAPLPPCTLN